MRSCTERSCEYVKNVKCVSFVVKYVSFVVKYVSFIVKYVSFVIKYVSFAVELISRKEEDTGGGRAEGRRAREDEEGKQKR